jgi:hypothetical protein
LGVHRDHAGHRRQRAADLGASMEDGADTHRDSWPDHDEEHDHALMKGGA